MANSRELSQFGRLVEIKDGSHIGIGTQSDVAIGFGTITAIQVGDSNTVYYGDGSNLSGVSASGGAGSIGIQSAGNLVGTATTINFGSGVTITDNVASVSVGSTTRFVGARLYHDNFSTTTTNAWTEVTNWDGTAIDTHSFVDSSHGFTIPAGVSKVRFTVGGRPNGTNVANQWTVAKNGSFLQTNDGGIFAEAEANIGYYNGAFSGVTAVLEVSAGDAFDLRYYINSTTPTWDLFFQIEVVEGDILGTYFSANNIVDDPTPQLGGNLDLNSNNITGTGNIDITGNLILNGTNGLEISDNGTTGVIQANNTNGRITLEVNNSGGGNSAELIQLRGTGNLISANFKPDSGVQLYGRTGSNSAAVRLETNSTGVDVTGDMIATGSVGIGSTVVGVTTSTGSLIYVPSKGIQVWTGYSWRTIDSTSAVTYTMTQDQTARDEGQTVTFTINTSGLPNGYVLYWTTKTVSGTINAADFSDGATQGTVTLNAGGQGSIARTIANDANTEGTESFTIELREGSTSGEIVAEGDTVTISDTSLNATYATLVQGAYTGSTISGLSWSGTAVNDTGGVSSIPIPNNRKTYIEIYWNQNGGGHPGPGVARNQNTELGLASYKGWYRIHSSSSSAMEVSSYSFTDVSGSHSIGGSTGDYFGIGMDNTANNGSGSITFYRNGNAMFTGGNGWTSRSDLYFHWQNNGYATSSGTFNFGATSFQYPLSGYSGLYS